MEKTLKVRKSSELYRIINALKLTPAAREQALATLARAENYASKAVWLFGKIRQIGAAAPAGRVAVGAKLKHQ